MDGRLNIVRLTYKSIQSLPKSQQDFFVEIHKLIPKFIWKSKEPRIAKTISKKNRVESFTLSNFTTYSKAIVVKTVVLTEG